MEPINGMMLKITHLARKNCYIFEQKFLAFKIIYSTDNLRKIYYYSVGSTAETAFVIGGFDGASYFDMVAQFKNDQWSLYGTLQKGRRLHGSVTSGSLTMVIGGDTKDDS